MKRGGTKTVRKVPKDEASEDRKPGKPGKPGDLASIRERINDLVGREAQSMVAITIEEVGKGHYMAMKYLFEMIGLYPAAVEEEAFVDDSLARTLLRRLGLPEEPLLETSVTKEYEADQPPAKEDTVK